MGEVKNYTIRKVLCPCGNDTYNPIGAYKWKCCNCGKVTKRNYRKKTFEMWKKKYGGNLNEN